MRIIYVSYIIRNKYVPASQKHIQLTSSVDNVKNIMILYTIRIEVYVSFLLV